MGQAEQKCGPHRRFCFGYENIAVFAYDQGEIMHDGFAAPHRRVGMFLGDYTASHFTSQGWQLFDNAVQWAMSTSN